MERKNITNDEMTYGKRKKTLKGLHTPTEGRAFTKKALQTKEDREKQVKK